MEAIEVPVSIQVHSHARDLPLPSYQTPGSSGFDLLAAVDQEFLLKPGARALIPTGVSFALPLGYECQIRPRSGLALKHGITMLNSPGTIDSDYRGEIKVIAVNLSQEDFKVTRGMRIAQAVIGQIVKAKLIPADNLDATTRGAGGFGHTGTH